MILFPFEHIFDFIALSTDVNYLVRASYLEIYNENIRDLLAKDPDNKLDLKEHPDSGVYVKVKKLINTFNMFSYNLILFPRLRWRLPKIVFIVNRYVFTLLLLYVMCTTFPRTYENDKCE